MNTTGPTHMCVCVSHHLLRDVDHHRGHGWRWWFYANVTIDVVGTAAERAAREKSIEDEEGGSW